MQCPQPPPPSPVHPVDPVSWLQTPPAAGGDPHADPDESTFPSEYTHLKFVIVRVPVMVQVHWPGGHVCVPILQLSSYCQEAVQVFVQDSTEFVHPTHVPPLHTRVTVRLPVCPQAALHVPGIAVHVPGVGGVGGAEQLRESRIITGFGIGQVTRSGQRTSVPLPPGTGHGLQDLFDGQLQVP